MEKRVLERIGYVMRMEDERMTKAVVLGWMLDLEKWDKKPGRTRKIVLYWRKLLKEAGIDYTQIGRSEDRKAWKGIVGERMRHLNEYERSKGNKWKGQWMIRNKVVEGQSSGSVRSAAKCVGQRAVLQFIRRGCIRSLSLRSPSIAKNAANPSLRKLISLTT